MDEGEEDMVFEDIEDRAETHQGDVGSYPPLMLFRILKDREMCLHVIYATKRVMLRPTAGLIPKIKGITSKESIRKELKTWALTHP